MDKISFQTLIPGHHGDKIGVFSNTVSHNGECGELNAKIYVNDNKVAWDEDDDDCYSLSVGCSWTINE